jgi:hypothetical protein
VPLSALSGLAISRRSRVRAVLADGSQISQPLVRTRHLPVLSMISGGRVPDPEQDG